MPISSKEHALWRLLAAAPRRIDLPLAAKREAAEHAEDLTSEPAGVTHQSAPAVGGRWALPGADLTPGSAVLYLLVATGCRRPTRGASSPATWSGHQRRRLQMPAYRLASEYPFPAAVEDATSAY
jgi:acetyl esterase/lipase